MCDYSKASQARKRKLEELEGKLQSIKGKEFEVQSQVKRVKLSRTEDDADELERLVSKISELKKRKEELAVLNAQYQDSDPEVIAKEKLDINIARDAANRWTDNIFAVKSWIKNKFGMEEATINKQFEISPELDYIE
ncbi:unnamed protein product [Allacma fusca]|uniref:Leucine zipper with capping helix domain-containing protein n=1 Tax=Allacma fusca TaxID=39272 RepID=A0A8J2KVG8_9HEXA|nr:unnamed protein product [Allacma fusca]